jgi:hypothetical protein
MKVEVVTALPNSVLLVMDFKSGELPESMRGKLIAVSKTCVAVGTLAEDSGETHLVLADQLEEVDQANMHIAFDGRIGVTSGEVSLVSARNEKLRALPVTSTDVRVRVFVNDDTEPDRITVVVG